MRSGVGGVGPLLWRDGNGVWFGLVFDVYVLSCLVVSVWCSLLTV